ncbi:kinase-like domain-containing protein [Rhizophagus irregularis DAOM 181602=DAOM 197198]|nr:kinase-like domain-containing protein [Rhizophagus irregularis DAOM 181602=DAOM 197198]
MDSFTNSNKKLFNSSHINANEELYEICEICSYTCYAKRFQHYFENWTSDKTLEWIPYERFYNIKHIEEGRYKFNWVDGNIIDWDNKTQSWKRKGQNMNLKKALEWIPYSKLNDIRYITVNRDRANWVDGNIIDWVDETKGWKRGGQNMIVELKKLNDLKNITLEFMDENKVFYGITHNPNTRDYMMVLNDKCIRYKANWIDGNIINLDNKTQSWKRKGQNMSVELKILSNPINISLEFMDEIKDWYQANWIDGNIINWDNNTQSWEREGQNLSVELKRLNDPKNITLEFMDEIKKAYGISQDPETKIYIIVLSNKCKECNSECYTTCFQRNFKNWTSGNNDIDKYIQDNQLSVHNNMKKALEWIPYNKFFFIRYIAKGRYMANWIDGNMVNWNNKTQSWKRKNPKMNVELKRLNNPKNITIEFKNKDTQLSAHNDVKKALEWIPNNKIIDVKNNIKDKYIANWVDGKIINWDNKTQSWKRDQNISVNLRSLGSKYITLKFINEIKIDYIIYGITQNPKTKDYMMVLDTQLSAHKDVGKVLEWIPNDRFNNIKCIAKDRYIANWIDGYIGDWDYGNKNWKRKGQNTIVELKKLINPNNITLMESK